MKRQLLVFFLFISAMLAAQQRDSVRSGRLEKALMPGVKIAFQHTRGINTLEAGYSHLLVFAPGGPCGIPFVGAGATASAEMRWNDGFVVSPKISLEGNLAFFMLRGSAVYDMRDSNRGMRYNVGMGLSSLGFAYALFGFEFPPEGEPARAAKYLELGMNIPFGLFGE